MPKVNRKPPKGEKSFVQSVLFDKSKWTVAEAKDWLKAHGRRSYQKHFHTDGMDERDTQYRFRQYDVANPDKFGWSTEKKKKGIKLVICYRR